jgi:uncharacterized protein (UPF0147 family)
MSDQQLGEVLKLITSLAGDVTIPKNIRKALSDAKERLESTEELNVKVSSAIYLIDSVSDDINMPAHARTQMWSLVSMLEALIK